MLVQRLIDQLSLSQSTVKYLGRTHESSRTSVDGINAAVTFCSVTNNLPMRVYANSETRP